MSVIIEQDFNNILNYNFINWDKLNNRTFLVTGATGLVGSMFVKFLLYYSTTKNCNLKVFALIRNEAKANAVFENETDHPNLKFILSDVTENFAVPDHIDYIIHAASVTASKYMVSNPVETLMTAIKGTTNILEIAKEQKIDSMVYLSSMEAYGITDAKKERIYETDLGYIDVLNPRSSYSEGKRICECLCAAYYSQHKVPVKIARLAQTFGAGVGKEDNRVFAQFAKSAINNQDIVLHTTGESFGNYCYTADVISAILCLLTNGKNSEAYTVVNEETTMQIKDMAKLVAEEIANENISVIIDIPENSAALGYAPSSTMHLSAEKIRGLGWRPTCGLKEMYQKMISDWNQ